MGFSPTEEISVLWVGLLPRSIRRLEVSSKVHRIPQPKIVTLSALQKTLVESFFDCAWGFGIEKSLGFLVIFCGLRLQGCKARKS